MSKQITKQELSEILGVKLVTIRSIESRDQLETKLREKGYKLISKQKEGRSYTYILEQFSQDKESLNNCMVSIFNTSNNEKIQSNYIMFRYKNLNRPITRKTLANLCNVNEETIRRWDNKMMESQLLNKDGYFYMALDFHIDKQPTYRLTCKEEYNSFVKNNLIIKNRNKKVNDYKNDLITKEEMLVFIDGSTKQLEANYGKVVYKISKFSLGKNQELLNIVINLIREVYKKHEDYFIQEWLEEEHIINKTARDYLEDFINQ